MSAAPVIEVDSIVTRFGRQTVHDGVSFSVPRGQIAALIGGSGSGKSVLVRVLTGLWPCAQGSVTAPDNRCVMVLPQKSYLPLGSLKGALLYPEPDSALSDAQLADALQRVGLAALVPRLDEVARWDQVLASGERQRLAIARALIKDAPLLILDEPTANLDPLTERQVHETLFEVIRDRTSLLITHRLVGLENVDEILVLDRGRIVERGTHASLLARSGRYRRLWDLQNRVLEEAI